LAPALPARPCPMPCKTDGQTDPGLPPAPPCPVWPPVFPNPGTRFPNPTVRAESGFRNPTVRATSAGPLKRGTVASDGHPHGQTHCCNYI
jgi:hypothetical protein